MIGDLRIDNRIGGEEVKRATKNEIKSLGSHINI